MANALDNLAKLKQSATRKPAKETKKKEIRVVDLTDTKLAQAVSNLCEVAYLSDQITPLLTQQKDAVKDEFFELWTQEMWDSRAKPENFKALVKQKEFSDDASCNFILKFMKDRLTAKLPNDSELTVHEVIEKMLCDVAGLSVKSAHNFVLQEIEVVDRVSLAAPLNEMLESQDPNLKSLGEKLLAYLMSSLTKGRKNVALAPISDEERAVGIVLTQHVSLKDGMLDRVFQYCESLGQLRKLLKFSGVVLQVSNFEFGISDTVPVRNERLQSAVAKYLGEGE